MFIKILFNSISLTKFSFINNKGIKFQLIVFNKDIKNISKYEINLIIGFLMETKQNYSLIAHINICDKISISIIYILLNKSKNVSDNIEFYLDIQEMLMKY